MRGIGAGRLSQDALPRLLAISLIVVLAAVLRFAELPSRGLIYWDEGKFLLEGVRLETGLRILAGAHTSMPTGKAIGTAKPTHAFLIALSFALLGIHDYSALFLNALASVLAVVLVYRIATLLFDSTVGLLAALVLAVSEYDIIYARSALSESDANALLLLGVLLWLHGRAAPTRGRRSTLLLLAAGFIFGLAFTTNYRISVYVAVVVGFDLMCGFRLRGLRRTVTRAVIWLIGGAIAPVAWELVDIAARARGTILFRSEITHGPSTYFAEALYQIHGGKQAEVVFDPRPYVQWFVAYQGWIPALLLALGIVIALRVHSFAWLAVLSPVAVPYLLYIWAPIIVPRNLAAAIPFTAILIAAALVTSARGIYGGLGRRAWRATEGQAHKVAVTEPSPTGTFPSTALRGRGQGWGAARTYLPVLLAASALLGVDGVRHSWRLSAERSGLTRAALYVERHHARLVLTTNEVPVFYLRGGNGRCDAAKVPHALQRLAADIRAGYSYALMDHHSWTVARVIQNHMRRVAQYPTTQTTAIGENLIAAENTHTPQGPYPIPYVDVFQLRLAGLPPPGDYTAQVCDLNVL